jgi:hypothetical protein
MTIIKKNGGVRVIVNAMKTINEFFNVLYLVTSKHIAMLEMCGGEYA